MTPTTPKKLREHVNANAVEWYVVGVVTAILVFQLGFGQHLHCWVFGGH